MTQGIKITGGPGKFELMLALFEGKGMSFSLENGEKLDVKLTAVQREDGSSENWNISGHYSNNRFNAFYTTRGNKGIFTPGHPLVKVL